MDPLVLAAGSALVNAMATDGWESARSAVLALWRRVHPERVPAIEGELGEVRSEVLAARQAGDGSAQEALAGDWQRRLQRLMADDPGLVVELRRVLAEELTPLLPAVEQTRIGKIELTAENVSGHGRLYQAGRDQHITER